MKPDWDKLSNEFKASDDVVVADVDCTADGKPLCDKYGVSGYPTIKTFKSKDSKGEDYSGGRTLGQLRKHAQKLGPQTLSMAMKIGIGVATVFVTWVAGSMLRIFP